MKHTASHIYINPQGVPCAPTSRVPSLPSGDSLVEQQDYTNQLNDAKAACIPIREEDRPTISKMLWEKDYDYKHHFSPNEYDFALKQFVKVETFYPVEPYEFEVINKYGDWEDRFESIAKIIRPLTIADLTEAALAAQNLPPDPRSKRIMLPPLPYNKERQIRRVNSAISLVHLLIPHADRTEIPELERAREILQRYKNTL